MDTEAEALQRFQMPGQLRILRDLFRMQLQIKPFLQTHLLNGSEIARPGTEREPVQGMPFASRVRKRLAKRNVLGWIVTRLSLLNLLDIGKDGAGQNQQDEQC